MKTTENKSILTRKQAAELLCVSLTTLKTWSDQKIIKAYRLGGRIYYKEKELLEALK